MSLIYFPTFYKDELVYSLLARGYIASGCVNYRQYANEVFEDGKAAPNIEFINGLSRQVKEYISKDITLSDVIDKHTMFPFYARFQDSKQQEQIRSALLQGKSIQNLLRLPQQKEEKFLCYCAQCVENDRKTFGETYWHRTHQMFGIRCCPIHKTRLIKSTVWISGKASPNFYPAEEYTADTGADDDAVSNVEIQLAEYNDTLINQPVKGGNVVSYIKDRINQTKYISNRGSIVKVSWLCRELAEYYKDIQSDNIGIKESWQIQKILAGQRNNPYDISQLAMFLNISAVDLSEKSGFTEISSKEVVRNFDIKVTELLKDGAGINEIARQLSVSSRTIRDIRDGRLTMDKKSVRGVGGNRTKDWKRIDKETLPIVKDVLEGWKKKEDRPIRITCYAVAKILNVQPKYFDKLPLCRDEIKRYEVSFEEYWAKEVEWAMQHIQKENLQMNWKQIRNLTNLNRANFQRCLPYLEDANVAEICKSL